MTKDLYSPDQVADQLGLHVRTVRNYVRDGRLKAVRIGKQYRIARTDVEALTGQKSASTVAPPERHIDVSTIVEISSVSRDEADRVSMGLTAGVNGQRPDEDPLRIDTIYDQARAHLKVIVCGGLPATTQLLKLIAVYVEER